MTPTLVVVERAAYVPGLLTYWERMHHCLPSGDMHLVLLRGRMKRGCPSVTRCTGRMKNRLHQLGGIAQDHSFRLLVHVGVMPDVEAQVPDGCRYIQVQPLTSSHTLGEVLYWHRSGALSCNEGRTQPLSSSMACFSEFGVANQFLPFRRRMPAWFSGSSEYTVAYLKGNETLDEVLRLAEHALLQTEGCVLIAASEWQKWCIRTLTLARENIYVMKNDATLPSLLKKCNHVMAPSSEYAIDALMLEKKVWFYEIERKGHRVIEDNGETMDLRFFLFPSWLLLEPGFLTHLGQVNICGTAVLDDTWLARVQPVVGKKNAQKARFSFERKFRKFFNDPERFFQDSDKAWLREIGRLVFR